MKQCKKCPWRKDVNPFEIPGYCVKKHEALRRTIAVPGRANFHERSLMLMACHESGVGSESVCVGWAHHQLGVGNNLALRLLALEREDLQKLELIGEQHESFEATVPARNGGG